MSAQNNPAAPAVAVPPTVEPPAVEPPAEEPPTVAVSNVEVSTCKTLDDIVSTYTFSKKTLANLQGIMKRYEVSGFSVESVPMALMSVMAEVNKIKKLKPSAMKQMMIAVLNHMVEVICPGDDTPLEAVLKQMIPNLIDQLQDIELGKKSCFC